MILIWRGFGFLVPLLPLVLSLLINWITDSLFGVEYFRENGWPLAFALWVTAGLLWSIGRALDRKSPSKVLIDPETHEQFHFVRKHDFFWIKMQIWAPIFVIAAIVVLYKRHGM